MAVMKGVSGLKARRTVSDAREGVPVDAVAEKDVPMGLRIPRATRNEWKVEAAKRHTTVRALILEAMSEHIKQK